MKKLITIIALLLCLPAMSELIRLSKDVHSLSDVTNISVVKTKTITSPENSNSYANYQPFTQVTLKINLKGCRDKLALLRYDYHESTQLGKVSLYIHAVNLHTKQSDRMNCLPRPFEKNINLPIPGIKREDIRLFIL